MSKVPTRSRVPHKATERTVAILECLRGSHRGLNISAIGRKLQIPKSSVHPILLTLEELGFLAKTADTGLYVLGPKAMQLGSGRTPETNFVRHGEQKANSDHGSY
jgi:DNA-binding IclR family transcriptional regulator